jgi:RNA polymerase sigma-70 factor (ECF subfamily)
MSTLGPEGRALFRSAQRDLTPTDADRARMDRVFAAKLGVAAGASATLATTGASASVPPAAAGGPAATTATGLVLAKILGVLAIVGASAALYFSFSRHDSTLGGVPAPAAHTAAAAPSQPVPVSTGAPAEHTDAPVVPFVTPYDLPSVASGRRASPATPTASTNAGTIAAETRLLRDADAALRGGDAILALKLLDEHARTYPKGVLREERSAERIFALCKLGRVSEARSEAAPFLRDNTESPLAASVRSSCGGDSDAP